MPGRTGDLFAQFSSFYSVNLRSVLRKGVYFHALPCAAMPPVPSFQPAGLFPADALLATVLDLAPGGIVLCTPICDEADTLVDMALAYLNPAAQRLLHLPVAPTATFTQ